MHRIVAATAGMVTNPSSQAPAANAVAVLTIALRCTAIGRQTPLSGPTTETQPVHELYPRNAFRVQTCNPEGTEFHLEALST